LPVGEDIATARGNIGIIKAYCDAGRISFEEAKERIAMEEATINSIMATAIESDVRSIEKVIEHDPPSYGFRWAANDARLRKRRHAGAARAPAQSVVRRRAEKGRRMKYTGLRNRVAVMLVRLQPQGSRIRINDPLDALPPPAEWAKMMEERKARGEITGGIVSKPAWWGTKQPEGRSRRT
jgi:hypothetical protein